MSEWYQAEEQDLDLDEHAKEVSILVTSNNSGNIYSYLTFDQILVLAERIKALKEE
jgi:hypothetical protein